MRSARSIMAALALPLVFGGFSYNPLVTEYYPGGLVVTRSLACNIGVKSEQVIPTPVLANTTWNDAQWLIWTKSGAAITVTAQPPSGTGNVSNLSNAMTGSFAVPVKPQTIDVDVLFDAGAANASNSVTINYSATCGSISFTQNFSIN